MSLVTDLRTIFTSTFDEAHFLLISHPSMTLPVCAIIGHLCLTRLFRRSMSATGALQCGLGGKIIGPLLQDFGGRKRRGGR